MKKIRFLVVNANDWFNKGDVTNRLGLVLALKKVFGKKEIEIYIESLTADKDMEYFERFQGVKVIESVFATRTRTGISAMVIETLRNLIFFLAFFVLGLFLRKFRKALARKNMREIHFRDKTREFLKIRNNVALLYSSDMVISSPGGFLHDAYPYILLINLLPMFLAMLLKKPFIIYNQSIGPFRSRILAWLTRLIICKARLITLREETSLIGFPKACTYIITADSTFSIRSYIKNIIKDTTIAKRQELDNWIRKLHELKTDKMLLVGITIVGYYVLYKSREKMLRYIDFLGTALRKINQEMRKKGLRVQYVILPQNANKYELKLIRKIEEILKRRYGISNILFIEEDFSPEEIFFLQNNILNFRQNTGLSTTNCL